MASFNKTVIISGMVILVITLIIVGVFVSKSLSESKFPPIESDCPDYWDVELSEDGKSTCVNNTNINSYTNISDQNKTKCTTYPTESFYANGSSSIDVLCSKADWANSCGIVWDGVTNSSEIKDCNKATI
tara:strand:- start:831 stop:1220 length:390 start_codon:yes stop_codon:yes gene_type:complete